MSGGDLGIDLPATRGPGSAAATPEAVERFAARIAESLQRAPLTLDPVDHRWQVGRLLKYAGTMTYWDLLGVVSAGSPEEVAPAYERLARVIHPSNAERLGLPAMAGRLSDLFAWATEAYLTLSDPQRARLYAQRHRPPAGAATAGGQPNRAEERKRIARERYDVALALEARGEIHFAIEVMQQAVIADPRPEFYELLARCQARNPRWRDRARASYAAALQLAPGRAELKAAIAELDALESTAADETTAADAGPTGRTSAVGAGEGSGSWWARARRWWSSLDQR